VLIFEDIRNIEQSKVQTEKAIMLIRECQDIYNIWGFAPLTIRQYEEIAAGNYDPMGYVMEQAAKSATGLRKLKIKHESIMDLIGLPDNYSEFESRVLNLRKFAQEEKRSLSMYTGIVYTAITIENGIAILDKEKFEQYKEIFRVYATNKKQAEISKIGEAAAKYITEFQNVLREIREVSNSGFGSQIIFDTRYFKSDENGFQFRYSQVPGMAIDFD